VGNQLVAFGENGVDVRLNHQASKRVARAVSCSHCSSIQGGANIAVDTNTRFGISNSPPPLALFHRSISAELDHCNDDKKEAKVSERRDLVGRGGRGGRGGGGATLDAAGRGRERAEGVGEMMQQDSRERERCAVQPPIVTSPDKSAPSCSHHFFY